MYASPCASHPAGAVFVQNFILICFFDGIINDDCAPKPCFEKTMFWKSHGGFCTQTPFAVLYNRVWVHGAIHWPDFDGFWRILRSKMRDFLLLMMDFTLKWGLRFTTGTSTSRLFRGMMAMTRCRFSFDFRSMFVRFSLILDRVSTDLRLFRLILVWFRSDLGITSRVAARTTTTYITRSSTAITVRFYAKSDDLMLKVTILHQQISILHQQITILHQQITIFLHFTGTPMMPMDKVLGKHSNQPPTKSVGMW